MMNFVLFILTTLKIYIVIRNFFCSVNTLSHIVNMRSQLSILQLSVLFLMPTVVNSQSIKAPQNSIQCGYHFTRRNDPDKAPAKYLNMRLDYVDGVSMFYDLFTYERDSLRVLAFDENGHTKNQEEYEKILTLPRPRFYDIAIVNFKNSEITQIYGPGPITIRANSEMISPDWELSEESCTIEGFICKKAMADYLGRNWTVWYTEDIPLPIGPWLLWGTPGLIVAAHDSEDIFCFRLIWTDKIDNTERNALIDSRYPNWSFQKNGGTKHFALSMKEAEQMSFRLRTEVAYLFEVTGARTNNIDELQKKARKYIPLIPSDYWKGK